MSVELVLSADCEKISSMPFSQLLGVFWESSHFLASASFNSLLTSGRGILPELVLLCPDVLLFKNSSYVRLGLLNKNCTRQVEAKVLFETIPRGVKMTNISREIALNSAEINGKIILGSRESQ